MDSSPFERLNETELYQMCVGAKLNPQPDMNKKELILLLEREMEVPLQKSVFDELREEIFHFVDEHWDILQSQVTCPAKARSITGCFGCVDAQVLSCVVSNPALEEFTQLRRK